MNLPDFKNTKVLVVGDVMLDRYIMGDSHRLSPEAPVPIVQVDTEDFRPGGTANVAANVAAMGGQCDLLCLTGKDHHAHTLKHLLKDQFGVGLEFISDTNSVTTVKTRVLSNNRQLVRYDIDGHFSNRSKNILLKRFMTIYQSYHIIIFSDYLKGALTYIDKMINISRASGIKTVVDPKVTDFSIYSGAYIITPNMMEFTKVVGPITDQDNLIEKANKLITEINVDAMCLTRGENGMSLFSRGNYNPIQIDATKLEVFDVSGAGDTVVAVLALCLAQGLTLKEAAILANTAAGISVRRTGTTVISREDVLRELSHLELSSTKIVAENELKNILALEKSKGGKIVFTNGCFDLIHVGHIKCLEKARQFGTLLVVAINSDNSIKRLKGEKRPINTLKDRLKILSALESVDYIVPFETDTPLDLIKTLNPDIVVKGGDYTEQDIVGHEFIRTNNGVIKIVPFIGKYSSTSLIEKITSIYKTNINKT